MSRWSRQSYIQSHAVLRDMHDLRDRGTVRLTTVSLLQPRRGRPGPARRSDRSIQPTGCLSGVWSAAVTAEAAPGDRSAVPKREPAGGDDQWNRPIAGVDIMDNLVRYVSTGTP